MYAIFSRSIKPRVSLVLGSKIVMGRLMLPTNLLGVLTLWPLDKSEFSSKGSFVYSVFRVSGRG